MRRWSISCKKVLQWIQTFCDGYENVENGYRCGTSVASRTTDNVGKIRQLLLRDRHLSIRIMEDKFNILVKSSEQLWPRIQVNETMCDVCLSSPKWSQNSNECSHATMRSIRWIKMAQFCSQLALRGHRFACIPHIQAANTRDLKARDRPTIWFRFRFGPKIYRQFGFVFLLG